MLKVDSETNAVFLTRGNSACLELELEDGSGNPFDFSDCEVKLGIKRSAFDTATVVEKTFNEDGKVYFAPTDTESLDFGDYVYDVEVKVTDDSGDEPVVDIYTPIAAAKFTIGYNVL